MRFRKKKTPGNARPGGGDQVSTHALSQAGARPGAGQDGRPDRTVPETEQDSGADAARASRRSLKNWRVRSRLLLLITIPTLTAVALGGFRIASSVTSAVGYQRVLELTTLSADITNLAQRLESERDQTVYFMASVRTPGHSTPLEQQVVNTTINDTNQAAATFRAQLARIRTSLPGLTQQHAVTALTELNTLKYLRAAAAHTKMPALQVVTEYTNVIDGLLVVEGDTAQGTSDPTLSQTVGVLGLVSRMQELASEQRAILTAALIQHSLDVAEQQALTAAQSAQQANLSSFELTATPAQLQFWQNSVFASHVDAANQEELQAQSLQASDGSLKYDPTTADDWYGSMSNEIVYQMGSVQRNLVSALTARAAALRNSAVTSAVAIGLAVLLVLAIALIFTVLVARSMVRPLRTLRAGALEVAGVRLPDTVRRMSESDGAAEPLEVEPIDVDSSDEIGEVARAFDQVHREALRLAANEAALRGNVNAMFMNLSRRSQSLVERQIRLIDDLEQGEQDSERLSNLFQLDHLATRMRRNSENLLVLAGHDVTRRWTQSVALVDVLRAAVSEIEQYERVTLNVQPGIAVRGQAVNDVVHLIAELVENATSFSAAETPVNVAGHLLGSGGVLLDISDQGVGMGAEEMAHANWRLDNPPVVDVAVSRRMGLFVVARLAARHGIRVRLRPAPAGGLTALVWLPDEVVSQEATASPAAHGVESSDTPEPAGLPGTREWQIADISREERADAFEALTAARTPRFTPLRPDLSETAAFSSLGPDLDDRPVGGFDDRPAGGFDDRPAGGQVRSFDQRGMPPPDTGPVSSAAGGPVPSSADPGGVPSGGATGPLPVFGAPVRADGQHLHNAAGEDGRASYGGEAGRPQRGVIVPPSAAGAGEANRLPIFESVESDWFRRGRHGAERTGAAAESAGGWASPADKGWQAAEAASAPASGGMTRSGLPKRVPRANLVPGSVGAAAGTPSAPARSAALTRERLASFQRGIRQGRAVVRDETVTGGDEDSAR